MTTGLDTFDKTVQEANLWLKDVMARLGTKDRHRAYVALRATLHALRDRIGPENAAHLGAQLPMLLRGLYYEGWRAGAAATKERRTARFVAHVKRELPRDSDVQIEAAVRAVLEVVSEKIDRGEAVKLAGIFPKEMRDLWPAAVGAAAQARRRPRPAKS